MKERHQKEVEEREAKKKEWKEKRAEILEKTKHDPKKYLFEKYKDDYKDRVESKLLEEKKAKLNEIRNFHKPIRREELDDHQKDYQEKIRLKNEQKRMERENYYAKIGYGQYDNSGYKTRAHENYKEEQRLQKE